MLTSVQSWFERVSPYSAVRYNALAHERLWLWALLSFALLKLLNFFGVPGIYSGMWPLAAVVFAIMQPVSGIEEFVRQTPGSTIVMARAFAILTLAGGLIGFKQAWTIWLTGLPLAFITVRNGLPWVRRHPLTAAPIFSASLVIVSYIWYQFFPLLQRYPVTGFDVFLGAVLAAAGGLVCGRAGLALATRFDPIPNG